MAVPETADTGPTAPGDGHIIFYIARGIEARRPRPRSKRAWFTRARSEGRVNTTNF